MSEYTGFPEMMEGRVKTLHPKIHGGLLARRDKADHLESAKTHAIEMIDLVVVNLYPFEETVAKADVSFEMAIENIDIGGPSMFDAAKNHDSVGVIVDNQDYSVTLKHSVMPTSWHVCAKRCLKVFQRTSAYDGAIAQYLETQLSDQEDEPDIAMISGIPTTLDISLPQVKSLRYGKNPHQKAALYGNFFDCFQQLQGKELSFNNIIDITATTYLIGEFQKPTVAILKHQSLE